jgi:hypothetical protein
LRRRLSFLKMPHQNGAAAQAKQADTSPATARSRDSIQPSGESTVTPDWLVIRPNTRRKARGKPIEEMMPDICTGC